MAKTEGSDNKRCFIIMPITTPEGMLGAYGGDVDHFRHVLDRLFKPAIEGAGLKAIPPKGKGDEVIQGRIIEELERADLVLCDMSTLNANVFFELGIRTALDKPACLVKDDVTEKPPFDIAPQYYATYVSNPVWNLDEEVKKLTEHISDSLARGEDSNSLWKYFGLTARGAPTKPGSLEEKIDFLASRFEHMEAAIEKEVARSEGMGGPFPGAPSVDGVRLGMCVQELKAEGGDLVGPILWSKLPLLEVHLSYSTPDDVRAKLGGVIKKYGFLPSFL